MTSLLPSRQRPGARDMAALISGPTPNLLTLIDGDDFQLYRFRAPFARFEVEGVSSHVLSLQHAAVSSVSYRVGEDRFAGPWESGTLNLLPASASRRIAWHQPVDFTSFWLSPQFCARVLESSRFQTAPLFAIRNLVMSQLLELLSRGVAVGEPYGRLYQEGLAISLVAHLAQLTRAPIATSKRHGLSPARLRRVLDFIETRMADDMPLARLAAEAGVSERYFCTMFKLAMGRPPHRYLIERRVERAKQHLREKRSMDITEIAMSVGFTSSAHFSTMFKSTVGVTPSDFRRAG